MGVWASPFCMGVDRETGQRADRLYPGACGGGAMRFDGFDDWVGGATTYGPMPDKGLSGVWLTWANPQNVVSTRSYVSQHFVSLLVVSRSHVDAVWSRDGLSHRGFGFAYYLVCAGTVGRFWIQGHRIAAPRCADLLGRALCWL